LASQNPYAPPQFSPSEPKPGEAFDPALLGPPTMVRFGVLGLTAGMSVLLYLDRFAISVATPAMMEELSLSKSEMGIVTGAFFFSYALAQVPSGWLSDKFGSRLTLTAYVVFWSLALGMMGFAASAMGLIALRLMLGVAQAGAYPSAAGLLKNWIPLTRRGVSNSIVSLGGRAGGMLSNFVTPLLMMLVGLIFGISTGQWRLVFAFYASLGILWAIVFALFYRNTPREHPWCNDSERALIAHGRLPETSKPPPDFGAIVLDYLLMLLKPNLWILSGINFLVNIGWIFLVTWMPTYLKEEYGASVWFAGVMTGLAGLAGMTGNLSGGITTDALVQRVGLTWGRRLPGLVASGGAALLYGALLGFEQIGIRHVLLAAAMFAGAYFLIDFGLGSIWAVYQDIGGKRVATVLGFANMCGNLAAALFSGVIGYLADNDNWKLVFLISCGCLVLTALCWLFVNPRVPMSAREGA
jgi:ACS family glucarate transporter-like MFS transporter